MPELMLTAKHQTGRFFLLAEKELLILKNRTLITNKGGVV